VRVCVADVGGLDARFLAGRLNRVNDLDLK
jgi:hypothetical protein